MRNKIEYATIGAGDDGNSVRAQIDRCIADRKITEVILVDEKTPELLPKIEAMLPALLYARSWSYSKYNPFVSKRGTNLTPKKKKRKK